MRRVKNPNINSTSPALMFARGVESIVREHLENPRRYEKKTDKRRAAIKPEPRGNFFSLLMRQFASL